MSETDIRFADAFAELTSAAGLSVETMERVFDAILAGQWTPVQVSGFVIALRTRGETAALIAAAAKSMRAAMLPVEHSFERVLDTCGTGGDGKGTLNLSTGAAVIAAAAGIPVAKHGNRAVSSRAGSADVLEALGIPVDLPANAARYVLEDANIAFLMAPVHHPAMRHAAVARRELGVRTIFNCLGPLANPARASHQLLGAYDDALRVVLAETLRSLGTRRAWVVHSSDGLDELSPHAPTHVTELTDGALRELTVSPEDFGISASPPGILQGADATDNARTLEAVLGGEPHPSRDAFLLNAAASLVVALEIPPREATERAAETIASGRARRTLERWREAAKKYRPDPSAHG